MEVAELAANKSAYEKIKKFVNENNEVYLAIKDAFTNHTPGGESSSREDATAVAHGKALGTRFPFNEMEKIARSPFVNKNQRSTGQDRSNDPDLT